MLPPFIQPVISWFRRGDPGYSEQIDQLNSELKDAVDKMNAVQRFLFDNASMIVPLGILLVVFLCFTYFQQWMAQIRAVGVCGPKAARCVWCHSKIHFWNRKKYQWGIWPIRRRPVHAHCYTEWDHKGRPKGDAIHALRKELDDAEAGNGSMSEQKTRKTKKSKKGSGGGKKGGKTKKHDVEHEPQESGVVYPDGTTRPHRRGSTEKMEV